MKIWKIIIIVLGACVLLGIGVWFFYSVTNPHNYKKIGDIAVPIGYERINTDDSHAAYLRALELQPRGTRVRYLKSRRLFKYRYRAAAVIDMPCISRSEDCADVCMHLYADYLFKHNRYSDISFKDINGKQHKYTGGRSEESFNKYMKAVFDCCSTYSLNRYLPRRELNDMQPGDVLVFPPANGHKMGHAVTIADVAINPRNGKKAFIMVEGNYPGVDIHVVRNPNILHNPWFYTDDLQRQMQRDKHPFNVLTLRYF